MNQQKQKTQYQEQIDLHHAFGHPVADEPGLPEPDLHPEIYLAANLCIEAASLLIKSSRAFDGGRRGLRIALLMEEVAEYLHAETCNNLEKIADGLCDIEVIADGTAAEYGIPLDDVRAEIHRANMSKLGPDGKPILDERGKFLKGPDYTPPDINGILEAAIGDS